MTLTITKIEYMKIFIPWQESMREAMQSWRSRSGTTPEEEDAYVIVQVHTDEGLVGLGEGGRSIRQVKQQGDQLIGKNLLQCNPYQLRYPFVHALFDLMGQALGAPAYQLLGGKYREKVPVAYWSPYLPPKETAIHAEEGRRKGFTVHKIKARPWDAVEQVKAMAAAAGDDYAIRIDPNETFEQPGITVQIDRDLEGYNVECFEDPVPKSHLEWYVLLRQKCRIPVAIHTSDIRQILQAVRLDATDFVNIGGSPQRVWQASAVCEAAGCPVWIQNEGHCLDIAAAFDAHLGAATKNANLPYDTLHFLRESHIVENPLIPENGFIPVPDGPGLGVKLDRKAVEKYRVE